MKHLLKNLWVVLLLGLVSVGCNRTSPPPEPLSVAELPGAIEKAFDKARPEAKAMAGHAVTLVRAQDYSKAFFTIQTLGAQPGLTKEQVIVTGRATLTLNGLLQEAQTKGDVQAAKTLESYRRDK